LVQGVGPKGLQLDRSRSGRIFSRSLPPVLHPSRLLPSSTGVGAVPQKDPETVALNAFNPETETSDSAMSFELMINTVTEAIASHRRQRFNEDEQAAALLPWFVRLCSVSPLYRNWSRVESEKLLDPIVPTEGFGDLTMSPKSPAQTFDSSSPAMEAS